jgi:hypothetical protein
MAGNKSGKGFMDNPDWNGEVYAGVTLREDGSIEHIEFGDQPFTFGGDNIGVGCHYVEYAGNMRGGDSVIEREFDGELETT